jgi:hypothetical protein
MPRALSATVKTKMPEKITIEIKKEDFEAFCNAVGLFKKDFLKHMKSSEADHKAGRTTKRKSLYELIGKN